MFEGRFSRDGGRPIPGLFAAGIDIGNVADHIYVGFLSYGAAFGYHRGRERGRPAGAPGGLGDRFLRLTG